MMMNNYQNYLENNMSDIQKYSDQVSSTRAFERASDDPVAAMQTIKSSHEYSENEQFQTNCTNATSWMQATESTVNQLNGVFKTTQEKVTEASNGTNSASDEANLGTSMQDYSSEIVTTLNSSFDGKYIFGEGTDGNAPFKIGTSADVVNGEDCTGKLMYCNYNAKDSNGNSMPTYIPVDSITASGTSSTATTTSIDDVKLSMPVDLNLGVKVSTSDGSIQSGTTFDAATSALDAIITGYSGTNETATNIVDQLSTVANSLTTSGDTSGLGGLLTNVQDAQNAVLKVDVGIGEKTNMLSFISSRLTDDNTNISTQLSSSMEVDPTQAIMKYNMSETVYKESLSVSSTALQESLIDFLK
jgi:flagellar hook-associated protein 3 FlgL